MEMFLVLLAIVVAAGAGFYIGQNFSASAKQRNALATKLQQAQDELDTFRNKVNNHFEKTANLFNNVSDSYQMLYDHMAKSSTQLCATENFRALPKSQNEILSSDRQEKSTSKQTNSTKSDSIKNDLNQTNREQELFDAEHLYNAYNYRNQNPTDNHPVNEATEPETTDSKPNIAETKDNEPNVVNIGSAKTVSKEPARDYATKD